MKNLFQFIGLVVLGFMFTYLPLKTPPPLTIAQTPNRLEKSTPVQSSAVDKGRVMDGDSSKQTSEEMFYGKEGKKEEFVLVYWLEDKVYYYICDLNHPECHLINQQNTFHRKSSEHVLSFDSQEQAETFINIISKQMALKPSSLQVDPSYAQ